MEYSKCLVMILTNYFLDFQKENDRWDVQLDIAAPLIILPETFFGNETSMV